MKNNLLMAMSLGGLGVALLLMVATPIDELTASELAVAKSEKKYQEFLADVSVDELNLAQGLLYNACIKSWCDFSESESN